MSLAEKVEDYLGAVIIGTILLKVLYEVVVSVFSSMPIIASYGTTLIVAAVVASVALAK